MLQEDNKEYALVLMMHLKKKNKTKRKCCIGFLGAKSKLAARQGFSNLYSGYHTEYIVCLSPVMKVIAWHGQTRVSQNPPGKTPKTYTYYHLLPKHTAAEYNVNNGYWS